MNIDFIDVKIVSQKTHHLRPVSSRFQAPMRSGSKCIWLPVLRPDRIIQEMSLGKPSRG